MKKTFLRTVSLLLVCVFLMLGGTACANKSGKAMLTLKKDGIKVSLSVNVYELLLTRLKGSLSFNGETVNGMTVNQSGFWEYSDKFNGTDLQTIDEYYRDNILQNCKIYLAALYLFEKEGLKLSATVEDEIEDKLDELVRTDGNGSKAKLNQVLSTYGVNYDILKEFYTVEAKLDTLKDHLYGANAEKLGNTVKDQYLEENYVHFRQILLVTYHYVYETDKNGDVIYYYSEGENRDRIFYDVHNGVKGYDKNGKELLDSNGDVIYFVDGTDNQKIAYNKIDGTPAYVLTEDGSDYKTTEMTAEELKAVKEKAEKLYAELQEDLSYSTFEAVMKKESADQAEVSEFDDGYYLQKKLAELALNENYMHLGDITSKLLEMQDGDVALVPSTSGYHIIKKYPHSEKAYEKEANKGQFEDFADGLITAEFLKKCESLFEDIELIEKVYQSAPTMKDVAINYYY